MPSIATITITIPAENPTIGHIQIGTVAPCLIDLYFGCSLLNYIIGLNPQDTAERLANAINGCGDESLSDFRNNYTASATVSDRTVTIVFHTDDCCGVPVQVFDKNGNSWTPSRGEYVANVECVRYDPSLETVDCNAYGGYHVWRFYTEPNGSCFGLCISDYRYVIDPISSPNPAPDCSVSPPFNYYIQLSTTQYSSYEEFNIGWSAFMDNFWNTNYGGHVNYLGNGIFEVTTNLEIWAEKQPTIDICDGLALVCKLHGGYSTSAIAYEDIVQHCCPILPPPPPPDPIPTPEKPDPVTLPIPERFSTIYDFLCCTELTLSGVKDVWIMDRSKYGGACLDSDGDGIIESIETNSGKWLHLCISYRGTELKADLVNNRNGSYWVHTLDTKVVELNQVNRNSLMRLINMKTIAIVRDGNDIYWFLGETVPLILKDVSGTVKKEKEAGNGYILKFVETSRVHMRTIAQSYIDTMVTTEMVTCDDLVPDEPDLILPLEDCIILPNEGTIIDN